MKIKELKDIHLDGIREVANIGGGHAASALSQMTGKNIMVQVPKIKILEIEEIPTLFDEPKSIVCGILTNFYGDITGRTLLVIPKSEAALLTDILLGRKPGETNIFREMELSSIREVSNILISAYLSAMSEFLGLLILPSVPYLVIDSVTAIMQSVYVDFTEEKEVAFCVETRFFFSEENKRLHGYLITIPDPEGLEVILKSLHLL